MKLHLFSSWICDTLIIFILYLLLYWEEIFLKVYYFSEMSLIITYGYQAELTLRNVSNNIWIPGRINSFNRRKEIFVYSLYFWCQLHLFSSWICDTLIIFILYLLLYWEEIFLKVYYFSILKQKPSNIAFWICGLKLISLCWMLRNVSNNNIWIPGRINVKKCL
jgi:hypothetical protein